MKCLSCGAENTENMKFCTNCGAPLNPAGAAQSGQPNPQNQFNGQPNPQNQFNGQPNPQNQFNGQPYPQNQFNGQPYPQNQFNGQPYPQNQFNGQPGGRITEEQFYALPTMEKCRKSIVACAILLYCSAAITFIVNVVLPGYFWGIIDVMLLLGLGLGIHLGKSRVCAVVACVYSCLNLIYMIIANGTTGGTLIVIASILSVIYTFRYKSAWKKYQETGILPTK